MASSGESTRSNENGLFPKLEKNRGLISLVGLILAVAALWVTITSLRNSVSGQNYFNERFTATLEKLTEIVTTNGEIRNQNAQQTKLISRQLEKDSKRFISTIDKLTEIIRTNSEIYSQNAQQTKLLLKQLEKDTIRGAFVSMTPKIWTKKEINNARYVSEAESIVFSSTQSWNIKKNAINLLVAAKKELGFAYLSQMPITDFNFGGNNLYGSNFNGSLLKNVNFHAKNNSAHTNLTNVSFDNAIIWNGGFNEALLTGASFNKSKLLEVDFSNSIVHGAQFKNAILESPIFQNTDLSSTSFRQATLVSPSFICKSTAEKCVYQFLDFTEAHLLQLNTVGPIIFENVKFDSAINLDNRIGFGANRLDLSGICLRSSSLNKAHFINATFNDSKLVEVEAKKANFKGADFNKAMLQDVDFTDADLVLAKFQSATIVSSYFKNASLEGANFQNSYIYTSIFSIEIPYSADFTGVVFDGGVHFRGNGINEDMLRAACLYDKNAEIYVNDEKIEGVKVCGKIKIKEMEMDGVLPGFRSKKKNQLVKNVCRCCRTL